ncbi:MAG TPA: GxxExxY protein [Chlamydiales bacterium]|nr:GxxExxY protein [Chlamydiales bacterium]
MQDEELTRQIIGTAIEVHKNLGPGLLESVYRICMCFELENRGLSFKHESMVPLVYKNRKLDCGFRMDFLIEDKVILELKAVEFILPVHGSQLLTYLRLMNKQVGLLINFNVPILKKGIQRYVLNAEESLPF